MPASQPTTSEPSRREYLPALRMITEGDSPECARSLAEDAERDGYLIKVCAWCIPAEVKRALMGFKNLSHACCLICAAELVAGRTEGSAESEAMP